MRNKLNNYVSESTVLTDTFFFDDIDSENTLNACEALVAQYRDIDLTVATESILASVATLIIRLLRKFAHVVVKYSHKLLKLSKIVRKLLMSLRDRYDEEYDSVKQKAILKWDMIQDIIKNADMYVKTYFNFDRKRYDADGKLVDVVDSYLDKLKAYKESDWDEKTINECKKVFDEYASVDKIYVKDLRPFETLGKKMYLTIKPKISSSEKDLVIHLDGMYEGVTPLKNVTFKEAGWPSYDNLNGTLSYCEDIANTGNKICDHIFNRGQKCYDNSVLFNEVIQHQKDKYSKDVLKLLSYLGQAFKDKSQYLLVYLDLLGMAVGVYERSINFVIAGLKNI